MHVTSWSESYPLRNSLMGVRGFRPVVCLICQLCFQTTCSARLGKAKPGNALHLTTEDDIRGASLRGRDLGALMKRSSSPVKEDFVDEERPTFKLSRGTSSLFFIAIELFFWRYDNRRGHGNLTFERGSV